MSDARHYITASRPLAAEAHVLRTAAGRHLFVVDASRLYDVPAAAPGVAPDGTAEALDAAVAEGSVGAWLDRMGLAGAPQVDDTPLDAPPLHALSLAIAQACNLACTYCYAQQGTFGGAATPMPLDVARQAVDRLVEQAAPGARLNLAFLGGEPLANRNVLRATTEHAVVRARERGVTLAFSITTNGTLLTDGDADFFEDHGFAVTVSLDGWGESHDALRPFKDGRGSFERVMRRVEPLLARQLRMQVSARVTVTPRNIDLRRTLDTFVEAGFYSVGFSPLLSSPTGRDELDAADLERMLGAMIDCGREFERRLRRGERYPFANMANAMREIARGTHRPYPCGAGAGYLGVSAEGELSACHRFVGNPVGAMGTLANGVDRSKQVLWLAERHVHRQEPCRTCWARYLCGGGCHHEVVHRGRPACDYIRGWLHYCLEAYLRLTADAVWPGDPRPSSPVVS